MLDEELDGEVVKKHLFFFIKAKILLVALIAIAKLQIELRDTDEPPDKRQLKCFHPQHHLKVNKLRHHICNLGFEKLVLKKNSSNSLIIFISDGKLGRYCPPVRIIQIDHDLTVTNPLRIQNLILYIVYFFYLFALVYEIQSKGFVSFGEPEDVGVFPA